MNRLLPGKNNWLRILLLLLSATAVLRVLLFAGESSVPGDSDIPAHCIKCHEESESVHIRRWRSSLHAKAGVGCADCHENHYGVKAALAAGRVHGEKTPPASLKSRVMEKVELCGKCHKKVGEVFLSSRHFRAVLEDGFAPTCIDCHSKMGDRLLNGAELADRCAKCHQLKGRAGKMWIPPDAVSLMEHLREVTMAEAIVQDRIETLQKRGLNVRKQARSAK